ncbi:replication protein P [Tolumonas lignilytica]|uniref:replication protein P n=1 Tax=Tolumonas lignilytica TaxID=1283284 RepID=UPI00068523E4|nr:replication protein P [Tolumonas lignilytica]
MTMQSLQKIAAGITPDNLPAIPAERKPVFISDRDTEVVNEIFERLQAIFPAWKHAFPKPEHLAAAKSEWTKALVEAGCVSDAHLTHGFRIAREQDIPFFPAPGQFIKWCQPTPETLGMPTIEQALHEISRHRASHPAVILAARATRFERETLSASEYQPVFERFYEVLVRRVMAGEDLSVEIPKALPKQKDIQISPEERQRIAEKWGPKIRELFKHGGAV